MHNEQLRFDLLHLKAKEFKLSLAQESWRLLMEHTEQNLLAGYQALWRLSDLHANSQVAIDIDKLSKALVSDYHYNIFNLSDTMLMGNIQKMLQILHHLKQVNTAPSIVLWTIAKDIRLILSLRHASAKSLGIWQAKAGLYQKALMKNTVRLEHLSAIYQLDALIKGVATTKAGNGDVWEAIMQLCLDITAGVHIDRPLADH